MKVPGVHRPFLVALGVMGLLLAASQFVHPSDSLRAIPLAFGFATMCLNFAWLLAIFRAAKRALLEALPIEPGRMVVICVLAVLLLPVGTAIVLYFLCRISARQASERDPVDGIEVRRCASESSALLFVTLLWVLVLLFCQELQLERFGQYRDAELPPISAVDLLGAPGAVIVALLHLAVLGTWITFLARTVPALFRSYRRMEGVRERPTPPKEPTT